MQRYKPTSNESGMALIMTLLVLAASSVVAISLGVQNVVETRIAANQKVTEIAFRNAEAGIEHARIILAGRFASDPRNLAGLRQSPIQPPTWTFLFSQLCDAGNQNSANYDPDCDDTARETKVNLGSEYDGVYKVFAKELTPPTAPAPVTDTDGIVVLRSVGLGPGGARQVVEVRIEANGDGSQIGYYAQEGGGPTKANINTHDKGQVSGGQIATGTLR